MKSERPTIIEIGGGFDLFLCGLLVLRHRPDAPCFFMGQGIERVQARFGNFEIKDVSVSRTGLAHCVLSTEKRISSISCSESPGSPVILVVTIDISRRDFVLNLEPMNLSFNRFWLRIAADKNECIWGCGEQFSYFNLRGRRFPLWTSEPGVGRVRSGPEASGSEVEGWARGDYYSTNYPQPTYLSSRRYALHVETTAYSVFDFIQSDFHEIEVWDLPERIEFWKRLDFAGLVTALADRFGRQPVLPEWLDHGAIIGLKDGDNSFQRLQCYADAGVEISGLWCEDWAGIRTTPFGRRLFWDWRWNPERISKLDERIASLHKRNIRFLGYINPYLCTDGSLYKLAETSGYLVLKRDSDEPYDLDFGAFLGGMIDFTNPNAFAWFQDEVIGQNLIDFGMSGWMADFGEYLPTDARLHDGSDARLAHNLWPVLWAKCNAQAVAQRGKTGDVLFFMRAGYSGIQGHCPSLWAGDQSVDWSRHDGIGTVICAALSSGLMGNAYHHSDIGGYTSLDGLCRTPELVMRWAELAAFTSVMRTHEANRPDENLQVDGDASVLSHFARMTRIYRHLAPYRRGLCKEASQTGLPLQRPLFLHFPDDIQTYSIQTGFMLGPELLVYPVIDAGATMKTSYLPAGSRWIHVWSGQTYDGGCESDVHAPIGSPPLYYRENSSQARLFEQLANIS